MMMRYALLLSALLLTITRAEDAPPSASPSPSHPSQWPITYPTISSDNPTPWPAGNPTAPYYDNEEANQNEVKQILKHMENEVLSFRDELESVYSLRCNTNTLSQCGNANLNDCSSSFPNQQCLEPNELVISKCGDGNSCNALWDKSHSTVSIPAALAQAPFNNPTDPELIESACYTRLAEPYMVEKYAEDEEYWSRYNLSPSWTYFGAHNGLFRRVPAMHQETCGNYDPRKRPWFVAASSGPKDVVLIIDTSGSMSDNDRMRIAKLAAITVVSTLTVADRFAIVSFNSVATQIGGDNKLIRATKENKRRLIGAINQLEAGGATNFFDAFSVAFNSLSNTIRSEFTSGCNIAILFMTDGVITEGPDEGAVTTLVNYQTRYLSLTYGRNTTVFTYSMGQGADHAVTKKLACKTGGIWSPVDDLSGDLVTAMSSYYKLYALGLGEGGNEDFVSWVEPYEFANPPGRMGTTVSVPVYDRSVTPPLFLGVAAIDMYMDAFEQVLGDDATSKNMLDRFVRLSTARCPKIELTEVELDALRFLGGGMEATCRSSSSSFFPGVVPEKCSFYSDLPNNLWDNTDLEGLEYTDRACCERGIAVSATCSNAGLDFSSPGGTGLLIGIVVGTLAAIVIGCCFCVKLLKQSGGGKGSGGKIVYQIGGNNANTVAFGAQQTPTVVPNQPIMVAPVHTHAQHNQPVVVAAPPMPVMAATTMPPPTQGYVVQQPNTVYHSQQPNPNATTISYASQLPQQVVQAMVMTAPSAPSY